VCVDFCFITQYLERKRRINAVLMSYSGATDTFSVSDIRYSHTFPPVAVFKFQNLYFSLLYSQMLDFPVC
jgi:hypothetical protein